MTHEVDNLKTQLARAFGAIITSRRKAQGLTQAAFAAQLNIEEEAISQLEAGMLPLTLRRLFRLIEYSDCNIQATSTASIEKQERFLTVSIYPEANSRTPWIRLRGLWLRQAGFTPKSRIRVQVMPGCLVITKM